MVAMKLLRNKWFLVALRIILGGLFIYASIHKIIHPDRFLLAVNNYRFLPEFIARPFAAIMPWCELLCGIGLISGVFLRGAALITAALYLAFIIAMAQALARGLNISCGCFTETETEPIHVLTLIRDIALFLMAFWVFFAYTFKKPAESDFSARA